MKKTKHDENLNKAVSTTKIFHSFDEYLKYYFPKTYKHKQKKGEMPKVLGAYLVEQSLRLFDEEEIISVKKTAELS